MQVGPGIGDRLVQDMGFDIMTVPRLRTMTAECGGSSP